MEFLRRQQRFLWRGRAGLLPRLQAQEPASFPKVLDSLCSCDLCLSETYRLEEDSGSGLGLAGVRAALAAKDPLLPGGAPSGPPWSPSSSVCLSPGLRSARRSSCSRSSPPGHGRCCQHLRPPPRQRQRFPSFSQVWGLWWRWACCCLPCPRPPPVLLSVPYRFQERFDRSE